MDGVGAAIPMASAGTVGTVPVGTSAGVAGMADGRPDGDITTTIIIPDGIPVADTGEAATYIGEMPTPTGALTASVVRAVTESLPATE